MPRAPARVSTLFYKCRILSAFFLHFFTPPRLVMGQKCRNPLQYKAFRGVRGGGFSGLIVLANLPIVLANLPIVLGILPIVLDYMY